MQGKPWMAPLKNWLTAGWVDVLAGLWVDVLAGLYRRAGQDGACAERTARLILAMARGLLFELALTGERETVDAALLDFADRMTASRHDTDDE